MKIIGITGGVGSGKSEVLKWIGELCSCRILIADEVAHALEMPGAECYRPLICLLGEGILAEDGKIDKSKMASAIFEESTKDRLTQVNAIIHPTVKRYILSEIKAEQDKGIADYFFIEAALLIEDGYTEVFDELWYIYADIETRKRRLRESRGYTDDKIEGIMKAQSDETAFRRYCSRVIDNSGDTAHTIDQIKALFKR